MRKRLATEIYKIYSKRGKKTFFFNKNIKFGHVTSYYPLVGVSLLFFFSLYHFTCCCFCYCCFMVFFNIYLLVFRIHFFLLLLFLLIWLVMLLLLSPTYSCSSQDKSNNNTQPFFFLFCFGKSWCVCEKKRKKQNTHIYICIQSSERKRYNTVIFNWIYDRWVLFHHHHLRLASFLSLNNKCYAMRFAYTLCCCDCGCIVVVIIFQSHFNSNTVDLRRSSISFGRSIFIPSPTENISFCLIMILKQKEKQWEIKWIVFNVKIINGENFETERGLFLLCILSISILFIFLIRFKHILWMDCRVAVCKFHFNVH